MASASGWGTAPSRSTTSTGRRRCSATSRTRRRTNAKGAAFVDFTPLAELGELQQVVYMGDGKKHLTWDYLKALTPLALAIWYMDDGCFTVRSKGVQARTAGGSGRDRDLRRGDEPGLAGASGRATSRAPIGLDVQGHRSVVPARRRCCSSRLPRRRGSRSWSRRTSTRRWTTSCCHASGASSTVAAAVRRAALRPGAGADPRRPRQAARRGRCTGSTSRSRATTTTSSTA